MVKNKQTNPTPKLKDQKTPDSSSTQNFPTSIDLKPIISNLLSQNPENSSLKLTILTETREKILALKTFIKQNFNLKIVNLTPGTGTNTELEKLSNPHQVLISNPLRFFYHLGLSKKSKTIDPESMNLVVVDDVDSILASETSESLIKFLQSLKQDTKVLVVAKVLNDRVKRFMELFSGFEYCVEELAQTAQVGEIKASMVYVKVNVEKKFLLLYTFLFKNKQKKVVVLFNTSNEVIYFSGMLEKLGLENLASHSLKSQEKITKIHQTFISNPSSILLSTAEIASNMKNSARDFVIVFDLDPLPQLQTCLQLISCEKGKIIFLAAEQEIDSLQQSMGQVTEMKIKENQIWNIQEKIEKIVKKDYDMHKKAREGYKNYILSTKLRQYHSIAKNFGLEKAFLVNNLT